MLIEVAIDELFDKGWRQNVELRRGWAQATAMTERGRFGLMDLNDAVARLSYVPLDEMTSIVSVVAVDGKS